MTSLRSCIPCSVAFSFALFAPLAVGAAGLTDAQAKTLFNERGCNACHAVDEQRIGPPFRIVALRYAGDYAKDPDALTSRLAQKVRFGGAGAWGYIPMVANPTVSADEAQTIARWILGLKPEVHQ